MKRIHEDLPYADFEMPENIIQVQVCKESGKLPIEGVCDMDPRGSAVITEYFAEGTEPTEYCDHHAYAFMCDESGMLAGSGCPSTTYGLYILGGSKESEDGPYALTELCPLHNNTVPAE